jgi:hypothetical protein
MLTPRMINAPVSKMLGLTQTGVMVDGPQPQHQVGSPT